MDAEVTAIFESELPAILARNAAQAHGFNATYQMHVVGAGSWFLDLSPTGPQVIPGVQPADCTVTTTVEDFHRIRAKPSLGLDLFLTGRMKVVGSTFLATKLHKLFSFK